MPAAMVTLSEWFIHESNQFCGAPETAPASVSAGISQEPGMPMTLDDNNSRTPCSCAQSSTSEVLPMAGSTAIENGLPLSSDQGENLTKNRQNPGGVARRQGRTVGEELAGVASMILATRRVTPQEGAATAFNPWTALAVGWKGEA